MTDRFSLDLLTKEPNQLELFLQACDQAIKKEEKPIILFGAGLLGEFYLKSLKKLDSVKEIYFCDNNPEKWGKLIEAVPVISFDELKKNFRNSYIIITSLRYYDEIRLQLQEHHLEPFISLPYDTLRSLLTNDLRDYESFNYNYLELIQNNFDKFSKVYSFLSDDISKQVFVARLNYYITFDAHHFIPYVSKSPQYFESEIISLSDKEIFLDGGAYIGDTVEEFLKQTNGKYAKIFCFEPEESKHREFWHKFLGKENIMLLSYGLWSNNSVVRFNAQGDSGSGIRENGNKEIPVVAIDEFLNGNPVSFIKLDIEGAELQALEGAKETIRKYKPKIAISAYHKPLDIVNIPLYLKEIVPEYRIYLRHYRDNASETVCYGLI